MDLVQRNRAGRRSSALVSVAAAARHIGPMAQDFMATFHVGGSDKLIYPLDENGVALAAIQALEARVRRLERENARLARRLRASSP